MTAPSWPLAPVRCAAPEPVALCPVVHRRLDGAHTYLWCGRPHGRALVAYFEWRDAQSTRAPARGRCGRSIVT